MRALRTVGLALLFLAGMLVALPVAIYIFFRSLGRGARAFHRYGSVCRAEIVALDAALGAPLAGSARVRFSPSTAAENSLSTGIIGLAIKIGEGREQQDLVVATFEAFAKLADATKNTNVEDYMANQYGSVSPWRHPALGPIWFRAIPVPEASVPKTGPRTDRLDADIAAGRARFVIEARERPFADGKVIARIAELRLVERLPADEAAFHVSMFHTGRGIKPTGFRNGLRSVVYPVSQLARGLRGG